MARLRYPDGDPTVLVRSAVGRFGDLAAVVGGNCLCMAYRDAGRGVDRPAYMADECAREPGPGVLAYVDDVVAGWCSIAPRESYRRLMHSRTIPLLRGEAVWAVVCFVVRTGYRGHGLMHTLLDGAVAHAAAHGARAVEGYPVEDGGRVDLTSAYVGSAPLFERAGFVRASGTDAHSGHRPRVIMRRELGA